MAKSMDDSKTCRKCGEKNASSVVKCRSCETPLETESTRIGSHLDESHDHTNLSRNPQIQLKTGKTPTDSPKTDPGSQKPDDSNRQIGKFKLIRFLGSGGMGEVHLAKHHITGELVALKVIRRTLADSEEIRKRFLTEALAMKKIQHGNVVRVHDIDEDNGHLYFTMEFLTGISLKDVIREYRNRKRFIPFLKTISLMEQICQGVHAAHKKGIIHRDLKPSNIIISIANDSIGSEPPNRPESIINDLFEKDADKGFPDESIKVLDFGLAKMLGLSDETIVGQQIGTPYYMAPEQLEGYTSSADARSDVFSLGIIFYELLTNHIPSGLSIEMTSNLRGEKLDDIDLLIKKCTGFDPGSRYETAWEVLKHIRHFKSKVFFDRTLAKPGSRVHGDIEPSECLFESVEAVAGSEKHQKIELLVFSLIGLLCSAGIIYQLYQWRIATIQPLASISSSIAEVNHEELIGPSPTESTKQSSLYEAVGNPSPTLQSVTATGYVFIKPGSFTMGSPETEAGRSSDEIQHEVQINHGFWIKESEVTQSEFETVMEYNPSKFKGSNRPVENVSWFEAVEFCNRLSKKEGLEPCYVRSENSVFWNKKTNGYRLPTEAEWEYASRADTKTAIYSGNLNIIGERNCPELDKIAWYGGNSGIDDGIDSSGWNETQYNHLKAGTHPVKRKKPNALGLYDMIGNTWEWCWDWYAEFSSERYKDFSDPLSGTCRVNRGGSWRNQAIYCRSSSRNNSPPLNKYDYLGFRTARSE